MRYDKFQKIFHKRTNLEEIRSVNFYLILKSEDNYNTIN